jgi:hypothetical protein
MAIQINSTFFGGEVKPSVSCLKISRNAKEPCGVRKRYFVSKIPPIFLAKFLPYSFLGVRAGILQRALVDE